MRTLEQFKTIKDFVEKPAQFHEFGVVMHGYFPYETAKIVDNVRVSSDFFKHFKHSLLKAGISDNKYVVICSPISGFGDERFAIQFKDGWVKMGKWDDVIPYCEKEFKLKSKPDDSK